MLARATNTGDDPSEPPPRRQPHEGRSPSESRKPRGSQRGGRGRGSAPTRGRHRGSNAPRTRLKPRQPNARSYAPTLSEWCAAVARLGRNPHPAAVTKYATALQHVNGDAVAADVQAVLPRVTQIVQHTPGDKRKASMLDALGASVQAHPPLLAAVSGNDELCALLDWALGLAAADGETYDNAFCTAQMATAQVKLGRFCAPYWRGLDRHGAQHLGERALPTVVHRAAAMRESGADAGILQSGQGVCKMLCGALLQSGESLQAQAVANVLLSFPKLGWQLDGQLRDELLLAAERTSVQMDPQHVATRCGRWPRCGCSPVRSCRRRCSAPRNV